MIYVQAQLGSIGVILIWYKQYMKKKVTDKDIILFIRTHLDLQGEVPAKDLTIFECITIDDCIKALNIAFGYAHIIITSYGENLFDISYKLNLMKNNICVEVSDKTAYKAAIELVRKILANKSNFMEDE